MHFKRNTPPEERFWAYVIQSEGCWGWRGGRFHEFGYAQMTVGPSGQRKVILAHRLSWQIHVGPIPAGMAVLHQCDNPPCTNPAHLFLGTQGDNVRDRDSKGRAGLRTTLPRPGEANPYAKLTEAAVTAIRSRYRRGSHDANTVTLAAEFGVSQFTVWSVVKGRRWTHLA